MAVENLVRIEDRQFYFGNKFVRSILEDSLSKVIRQINVKTREGNSDDRYNLDVYLGEKSRSKGCNGSMHIEARGISYEYVITHSNDLVGHLNWLLTQRKETEKKSVEVVPTDSSDLGQVQNANIINEGKFYLDLCLQVER